MADLAQVYNTINGGSCKLQSLGKNKGLFIQQIFTKCLLCGWCLGAWDVKMNGTWALSSRSS